MGMKINKDKVKKEKAIEVNSVNGKITRIGKLVKIFKNTNSKYKYKVRVAPGVFIYTKRF